MSETDVRIETQASIYFQFAKFAEKRGDLGAVLLCYAYDLQADLHGGTSGQQNPHQGSVCLC